MMENIDKNKAYWEAIFDQATEDISTYLWAISEWPEESEEYDPEYLLIQALSHRARGRRALAQMNTPELPLEYRRYQEKLIAMNNEAESILNAQVHANAVDMEKLLEAGGYKRLEALEQLLLTVRRTAQDGDLYNDPEMVAEPLRDLAHDFLIIFQDMALAREELVQAFPDRTVAPGFHEKYQSLENSFRNYFGYFFEVRDLLPKIREREYGAGHWWLNRQIDPEDIREDPIPEEYMQGLRALVMELDEAATQDCPETEQVMAYADGELETPEETARVREHIHECRACQSLYLDMLDAQHASRESQIPELLPEVYAALYGQTDSEKAARDTAPSVSGAVADARKKIGSVSGKVGEGMITAWDFLRETLVGNASYSLRQLEMKEGAEKEEVELERLIPVTAWLEGDTAVIPRPGDGEMLDKLFDLLNSENRIYGKLMGMDPADPEGKWRRMKQIKPEVSENEIRIPVGAFRYMVWVIDPGKMDLNTGFKAIQGILNKEITVAEAEVEPTTSAIWIEVKED